MSVHDDPKIKHLRYIIDELLESGTMTRFVESFTDDVVYRLTLGPGTPLSGVFRGKAEVMPFLERMMQELEIVEFHPHDYYTSDGDKVIITVTEKLRITKNDEICSVLTAVVLTFAPPDPETGARDKICEITVIEDLDPYRRAYVDAGESRGGAEA